MQVKIFCSTSIENLITDEIEFIAHHLKSYDTEDLPERLVIYEFYESCFEKIDEFTEILETAESIKDRFLLFLIKNLNGYNIQFNSGHDPNLTEIEIN